MNANIKEDIKMTVSMVIWIGTLIGIPRAIFVVPVGIVVALLILGTIIQWMERRGYVELEAKSEEYGESAFWKWMYKDIDNGRWE